MDLESTDASPIRGKWWPATTVTGAAAFSPSRGRFVSDGFDPRVLVDFCGFNWLQYSSLTHSLTKAHLNLHLWSRNYSRCARKRAKRMHGRPVPSALATAPATYMTTSPMEHRAKPRVSVACTACRNQHLRCDAQHPICGRCRSLSRACAYPESRRSTKFRIQKRTSAPGATAIAHQPHQVVTPSYTASNLGSDARGGSDSSHSPSALTARSCSDTDNSLLDLYYEYFHPSHPFVLPHPALLARLSVTDESPSLRLLVNVMMYIGSCYRDSVTPPHNLRESVYSFDWAVDGFTVQSTMLMS
jgi:hypothetical protein